MFEILATGDYYVDLGAAADGRALPDLGPALDAVSRERFRRIDRFERLALLGSGLCVGTRRLPPRTGLYIGSGFGSIANTQTVQQQIHVQRRIPKPMNFINTLSNSAGYYVARNLDLHARNLFVGRDAAPAEAALQLATQDLALGNVEQALVGVLDEAPEPLTYHARRLGVAPDAPLAEGSHWFLLGAGGQADTLPRLCDVRTLYDPDELVAWFAAFDRDADARVYVTAGTPPEIRAACPDCEAFDPALAIYMSRTAGVVMRFLAGNAGRELTTVAGHDGRIHVMRFAKGG